MTSHQRAAAVFALAAVTAWPAASALAQPAAQPGGQPGAGQRTPPRAMRPGATADQPLGTSVLKGVVVAADTGAPLRRAQVRAVAEGVDNRIATTDEQGRFELRELAGGRYTLTASKGGFVTLQYGQRRPSERGTPLELAAGATLEKVVIGLPRGSVIAGRVVDEFGDPLTGAQVQVLRYVFTQGARRLVPAGTGNRTDDQGSFRVFGLAPGDYVVSATLREDRPGQRLRGDDEPTTGYAPTYFPGTTNAADAQRVSVGLGQEANGIVFGLSLAPLSRVSGHVVTPAGTAPGGLVMAVPSGGLTPGMGNGRGAAVRGDGTFELPGLPPGNYTLQVRPQGRGEDGGLAGSTAITVGGADLANVSIALLPTATASGRVEADSGVAGAFRAAQVRIGAMPVQPSQGQFGGNQQARAEDNGTFELRGLAAPATLRVSAPSGWYLKRITLDGRDVTDTPIAFEPGGKVTGLRVVLTSAAASLTGSVRDDKSQLLLDATVVIFPGDDTKWTYSSRFIHTARPDTTGRFEITGLPAASDYLVLAVQGLEEGQVFDPDFLASIRDRAERLTLSEGESKTLDLRLRQ